jgi:hypothetical protein
MSEIYETIKYKGYSINIMQDLDPLDPRTDWEPLGTMICFHRRYNLGDKHSYSNPNDLRRSMAREADPRIEDRIEYWETGKGWAHLMNKCAQVEECDEIVDKIIQSAIDKHYIVLPLYLYDHSGITMSTSPFSCPWDSGQVGIIFITNKKACEEYGWKHLNKSRRERIIKYLKSEVEIYDQYLTGSVYGYDVIELDEDGDDGDSIDSCWGYSGTDWKENGLLESAKSSIDHHIAKKEKEKAEEDRIEKEVEDFVYNSFAL